MRGCMVVRDGNGRMVVESGALNPDGSIAGNDNDEKPLKYEPHYREITSADQFQIYEPILKDSDGNVTTGTLVVSPSSDEILVRCALHGYASWV